MHYVVSCIDKAGHLPVRQANRAAHLDYAKANADTILVGGPYLDADGNMIGSLLIAEAVDLKTLQTVLADYFAGLAPADTAYLSKLTMRCASVDGACQSRKQFQIDPARQAGAFGGDDTPKARRLGIAVALGQPCEDPLDREVEQGPEPRGSHVDLALGVVLHVARGQFLVLGNVPRGRRRLDVEARDQVLTADFAHEAQAQLDEREPVALRLRHS